MQQAEARSFISPDLKNAVQFDPDSSATIVDSKAAERDQWQHWIDYYLIQWGANPDALEDEGVEPPTGDTIDLAIRYAKAFMDEGLPPPDSIVVDPNGGIVFERRENNMAEVIYFWDDGGVEYQCFVGARLVERCIWL